MEGRMKHYSTINEYISKSSKDVQDRLKKLRSKIKEIAPDAVESISYGMPAFKLKGKPLAYFAAYQHHIGFYPTSSPIKKFKNELEGYQWSKGAVQFLIDKPIPFDLVEKMVKYRMKEILE